MSCKKEQDQKRSKNFKDSEVETLLSLVETYKEIIENKKTDQVTFKEKEKIWLKIETQFNLLSGVYYCDSKTLKSKYENLKKSSKRKWADEKQYVMGTGGGPSKVSNITTTDIKIKELWGGMQVLGKMSGFDSDSVEIQHSKGEPSNLPTRLEKSDLGYDAGFNQMVFVEDEVIVSDHDYLAGNNVSLSLEDPKEIKNSEGQIQSATSGKFQVQSSPHKKERSLSFENQFSVKHLRNKTSSPLKVSKRKSAGLDNTLAGRKIEMMAKTKQDLFELQKTLIDKQIQHQEEEHSLKMQCIQEEHNKKMKLLDLKIQNEETNLKSKCVKTSLLDGF